MRSCCSDSHVKQAYAYYTTMSAPGSRVPERHVVLRATAVDAFLRFVRARASVVLNCRLTWTLAPWLNGTMSGAARAQLNQVESRAAMLLRKMMSPKAPKREQGHAGDGRGAGGTVAHKDGCNCIICKQVSTPAEQDLGEVEGGGYRFGSYGV